MSLDWSALDRLGRAGEFGELTGLVLAASEPERLTFAKEFTARLKALPPEEWWRGKVRPALGFALMGIGCLPSASRTAALLCRSGLRTAWAEIPTDHFLEIAHARQLPWLGDLGLRLAGRVTAQGSWSEEWRFVAALLHTAGAEPPVTEGVVRGWISATQRYERNGARVTMLGELRESPYLDLLLPSLFTIDGLGNALNNGHYDENSWQNTPAFPAAVAQLVSEGRLDRRQIYDATVERLVRGDRPAWLRPFTLLHDELAPTTAELATHTLDYARLLPDAPSPIATLAQRALRTLDEAGQVQLETVLEASHPVLFRKEKGLVKAQLAWLETIARREPARIAEVLETVTAALDHPSLDIRERAKTLIDRHGATPAAVPAPAPPSFALPPPTPPAAMPPPIADVVELAEEVVALIHEESGVRWERVLAGLVALRTADNLADTLKPILDRHADSFNKQWWFARPRIILLGEALFSLVAPDRHTGEWQRMIAAVRAAREEKPATTHPLLRNPEGVLSLRIAELSVDLLRTPVPELLATPTLVNGSLDPETLLARLARAEAADRPPWPADLEQALLRLPRQATDSVLADASKLTTAAGRRFAGWLATGGLPDPTSTRTDLRTPAGRHVLANLHPARTGGLLETHLTTLTRRNGTQFFVHDDDILPMVLPHHREITAAWSLPYLARTAINDDRGGGALLPLLAESTGPIGPATTLALTYICGACQESDRTAAVDAFLTLTAAGTPFTAALGTDIGDLCADSTVKLNRVARTLTDAHRAGASSTVWEVLAAAIPLLLPHTPRGLPDLLELATQVATETTTKLNLTGLPEMAANPGTTRLAREAKRLQKALTT